MEMEENVSESATISKTVFTNITVVSAILFLKETVNHFAIMSVT